MVHGSSEEKLVGGLEPPIVGMMIQSDELIFFRGVGQPPTRYGWVLIMVVNPMPLPLEDRHLWFFCGFNMTKISSPLPIVGLQKLR